MWLPEVITEYIEISYALKRYMRSIYYTTIEKTGNIDEITDRLNEAHKRIKQLYKHAVEMGF